MRVTRWLAGAALAAAALDLSCGKPTNTNDCGGGTAPSLVGNYSLAQYTYGAKVYSVPPASGGITYTAANTYSDFITVPSTGGVDSTVADSGLYQIVGTACIVHQSLTGQRQYSASFTLVTRQGITTLKENGSDSLHVIIYVWVKN